MWILLNLASFILYDHIKYQQNQSQECVHVTSIHDANTENDKTWSVVLPLIVDMRETG